MSRGQKHGKHSGVLFPRIRSYSMNAAVGTIAGAGPLEKLKRHAGLGPVAGWNRERIKPTSRGILIAKVSDATFPGPSKILDICG